jgi:uncharacterized protein YecA (UPF0149 family)
MTMAEVYVKPATGGEYSYLGQCDDHLSIEMSAATTAEFVKDEKPKWEPAARRNMPLRRLFTFRRNGPCPCGSGRKTKNCCRE